MKSAFSKITAPDTMPKPVLCLKRPSLFGGWVPKVGFGGFGGGVASPKAKTGAHRVVQAQKVTDVHELRK